MDLLPEPFRGHAQFLQKRFGLTPASACLFALANLSSIAGPSLRVQSPVDFSWVYPAFSVLLHGSPQTPISAAANIGWGPLREWIYQTKGQGGSRVKREVHLQIAELNSKLIEKDVRLQSLNAQQGRPSPSISSERSEREKELLTGRGDIVRSLNELTFRLAPHILADEVGLDQLLNPGFLSHDGAVMHASSGHSISIWAGASKKMINDLGRLLECSWQGSLQGADSEHPRPLLSNLFTVESSEAEHLASDMGLLRSGVLSQLFFVAALEAGAECDFHVEASNECEETWESGLNALLQTRLNGEVRGHELAKNASSLFLSYVHEVLAEGASSPASRRIERGPVLCLKIATLLHAGSLKRDEGLIESDVMAAAMAITRAVVASDLDFMNALGLRKSNLREPSEEQKLQSLVRRLELRGPLRWRDLLRGCRVQKAEPLRDLLKKGIDLGVIVDEGDLYRAAESERSNDSANF